nr:tyrosine-type recombinase/integrase [Planotetraspora mira]
MDLIGQLDALPPLPPHVAVWRSVRTDGDTKTRQSRRTLALPKRCVDVLRQHREKQLMCSGSIGRNRGVNRGSTGQRLVSSSRRRPASHCMPRTYGGPSAASSRTLTDWTAAWTPRELRHSFVSLLSDSGIPLKEISRLVGHSSTAVTEAVYRKQIRPVLQGGAVAIDRIFKDDPEP